MKRNGHPDADRILRETPQVKLKLPELLGKTEEPTWKLGQEQHRELQRAIDEALDHVRKTRQIQRAMRRVMDQGG